MTTIEHMTALARIHDTRQVAGPPRSASRAHSAGRALLAGGPVRAPASTGFTANPAPAAATPTPDEASFRAVLGKFATGVAFVTAAPDGEPAGLIVNSLTSVSLEPPLVLFCPSRSSLTWSRMRRTGRFGVNVLGRQHERFAMRATPAGADRFADIDWEPGPRGTPLLTDALASLECEIVAEHPTGDHSIVIGQVDNLHIAPNKDPLLFFAGAFRALQ